MMGRKRCWSRSTLAVRCCWPGSRGPRRPSSRSSADAASGFWSRRCHCAVTYIPESEPIALQGGSAMPRFRNLFVRSAACLCLTTHAEPEPRAELLVFAAASLTDVLQQIGQGYTAETGQPVKFSFAASSALARQIEAGARADLFLS